MILNKKQILDYQKNRDPYLMIDHVDDVEPGKFCRGYKYLDKEEWFFKVHWPEDPNMPGALQFESLSQMASLAILTLPNNKGKILYLTSAEQIKFYNDTINIPSNSTDFLEIKYGSDWKIPNKEWNVALDDGSIIR